MHFDKGEYESAIQHFERALEFWPDNTFIQQNLAAAKDKLAVKKQREKEAAEAKAKFERDKADSLSSLKGLGDDAGSRLKLKGLDDSGAFGQLKGLKDASDRGGPGLKGLDDTLASNVVDARNVPSDLPKEWQDLPAQAPGGAAVRDRVRKCLQAAALHDWHVAYAWLQDAQNQEPGNNELQKFLADLHSTFQKEEKKVARQKAAEEEENRKAAERAAEKGRQQYEQAHPPSPAVPSQEKDLSFLFPEESLRAAQAILARDNANHALQLSTPEDMALLFPTDKTSVSDAELQRFEDSRWQSFWQGISDEHKHWAANRLRTAQETEEMRASLAAAVQQIEKTSDEQHHKAFTEAVKCAGKVIADLKSGEARRHGIIATTLEKDAKEPSDYDLVIKEYDAALAAAPWWPEAMVSKAKTCEAQGQYQKAIDSLKHYLLTKPIEADARTAQDKIYALEAKLEKAHAEQQQRKHEEMQQRQEQEAKKAKVEDPAGEWMTSKGEIIIKITKSPKGYAASIPNDGVWYSNKYGLKQKETLREFSASGSKVHFVIRSSPSGAESIENIYDLKIQNGELVGSDVLKWNSGRIASEDGVTFTRKD